MTSEEKRIAKQQLVAGALLNTALDRLNELAAPYCLMIGGRIMSNQTEAHVRSQISDCANLLNAIAEKKLDAQAERIAFGITDSGGESDTIPA